MIILKGKLQGAELTLHQFANDWVTALEHDQPISLTSIAISEEELIVMKEDQHSGALWNEFELAKNNIIDNPDYPYRFVRRDS